MTGSRTIAYEFECGRRTIRATLNQFHGKTLLDLRTWYEPQPGSELQPTQKGISVPVEYLAELREAIDALGRAVKG